MSSVGAPQSRTRIEIFWWGQTLSILGGSLSALGVTYYLAILLELPPEQVAAVNTVNVLAAVIAPVLGGALGDRLDRRRALIRVEILRAVALAGLATLVLVGLRLPAVFAVVLFFATAFESIFNTIFAASIPDIFAAGDLEKANGRYQAINTSAETVGTVLGGALLTFLGPFLAFLFDALSFIVSGLTLAAVKFQPVSQESAGDKPRSQLITTGMREVLSGSLRLMRIGELRTLLLTSSAANIAITLTVLPLLLLLVRDVGFPFFVFTIILGVGSTGGILGGIFANKLTVILGGQRNAQFASLLVYGACLSAYGFVTDFNAVTMVACLVIDFLCGVSISLYIVNNWTAQQRLVPQNLRARAAALRTILNAGASALGTASSGVLLSFVVARNVQFLGGAMLILVGIAFAIATTSITRRRHDSGRG